MKWIGWIMKHLCYSKHLFLVLLLSLSLGASLLTKSAVFYYGEQISYSMVGIHDYIVIEPKNTNIYTHGFEVYNKKIYARVLLSDSLKENKKKITSLIKQGYHGIYLDQDGQGVKIQKLLEYFTALNPEVLFIAKYTPKINENSYEQLSAIVIDEKSNIKQKSLQKIEQSGIDIIKIVFVSSSGLQSTQKELQKIEKEGMIPYITTRTFQHYGLSSKRAIKREILTLIDEHKEDRTLLTAHQIGAMPMEYLGYIQKLYDVSQGLPELEKMHHYAGVVVWLNRNYKEPHKLIEWVLALKKMGIKVAFMGSFGFNADAMLLQPLGIEMYDGESSFQNKKKIVHKDKMIGFEIEPSLGQESIYIHPKDAKELLILENSHHKKTTLAAITPWGGYAVAEAFMVAMSGDNAWVINPFSFLQEALRLPKIAVPDTTTQNGNRIFFTHIDGDGMVSRVESNPELFSGDMILNKILKVYKVPHSVSLIGAEIEPTGLYPKLSPRVLEIAKEMYALDNVEPATHTFTHTFFWGKIKNGTLAPEYRLKPKNYHYSLGNELSKPLAFINTKLLSKEKEKRAKTLFWSGDCAPRVNALSYVYKHKILNINGGNTKINNLTPWLTLVAPMGLERGEYYQVYTGAQNENVFTHYWFGPFWGFKRVVQTFKLTNSPRRLKPIDIYYHLYSGSKTASLNALKYVFNWSLKQKILPMFTSEYIPKVMDYYTVSMAHIGDKWLVDGMKDLKTIRFENLIKEVQIEASKGLYGYKKFENHTYLSFGTGSKYLFSLGEKKIEEPYLISANAEVKTYNKGKKNIQYRFKGYIPLQLSFHIPKRCTLISSPKAQKRVEKEEEVELLFSDILEAKVHVICR